MTVPVIYFREGNNLTWDGKNRNRDGRWIFGEAGKLDLIGHKD